MAKFVAYIDQTSFGCDYTIACGKTLWELEAKTYNGAVAELKKRILGIYDKSQDIYDDDDGSYPDLDEVILFEVSNQEQIPLLNWYEEKASKKKIWKQKKKTEKRRRQYEILKEEFE
jgi:hypothetical protein